MDLLPNSEELLVEDGARNFLGRTHPAAEMPRRTATLTPGEFRAVAELGWFLPAIGDDAVASVTDQVLIAREIGRSVAPPTTLATMLATQVAVAAGDAALANGFAEGAHRAALGQANDAWRGPERGFLVIDAEHADHVLFEADGALKLAPMSAFEGVAEPGLDQVLVAKAGRLDHAQARRAAPLAAHARVLLAAALTGGTEAVRDLSVEYANTRVQFGKPIGAFQAISHKCSEMAVGAEASLALTQYAAVRVRDGAEDAMAYASAARMVAGKSAYVSAKDSMQLHGGYGQTYEYMPHFYLKRAILYGRLWGGAKGDAEHVLFETTA